MVKFKIAWMWGVGKWEIKAIFAEGGNAGGGADVSDKFRLECNHTK